MKKTRKILSILLALIMALSLCTVAFAEGDEPGEPEAPAVEYNWVRIPTSAEGLAKGAYYLDFNDLYDLFYNEDYLDITDETPAEDVAAAKAEMKAAAEAKIAEIAACEWYFDEAKCAFKGIVPEALAEEYWWLLQRPQVDGVNDDVADDEEASTVEVDPFICYRIFSQAFQIGKSILHQVGENFVPVKLSTEGLKDGDYYLDVEGAIAAAVAALRVLINKEYEEGKPVREDFESDGDYEEALAEYDRQFAEEMDESDEELAADMRESFIDTILALSFNTEDSSLLKINVFAKEKVYYEGGQEEEEMTEILPFFYKTVAVVYAEMYGVSFEEAEEMTAEGGIIVDAVLANIKQYKAEKKDDGGYSNNAFMRFIKKIIQAIKDFFAKIFKK